MLCDLFGAQFGVLERNVSVELAGAPQAAASSRRAPGSWPCSASTSPSSTEEDAGEGRGRAPARWPASVWNAAQPSEAMLAAYAANPDLASLRLDVTATLTELLAVIISGLLARA